MLLVFSFILDVAVGYRSMRLKVHAIFAIALTESFSRCLCKTGLVSDMNYKKPEHHL
jgi:hypothetical protein